METNKSFAFKELRVWQKGVEFADKVLDIPEHFSSSRKHFRLAEQLDKPLAVTWCFFY